MPAPEPHDSPQAGDPLQTPGLTQLGDLKRQESQYWYLLAAICIVTTGGMGVAISPVIQEWIAAAWPWASTGIVLLSGLTLSMALLVTYLTIQRAKAREMRLQVQAVLEESDTRARQNTARLRALLNVSRMMGSVTNMENVFNTITSTCLDVFNCQQASLMLVNNRTQRLVTRAVTGHVNEEVVKRATQRIGEGIAGWVAKHRQPLILSRDTDLTQYPALKLKDQNISAAMVAPILLRDELVGVLNISSRSPRTRYTDEDLQALKVFAENAGTCIRHTEHVEWMRKTLQDALDHSKAGRELAANEIEAHTQE